MKLPEIMWIQAEPDPDYVTPGGVYMWQTAYYWLPSTDVCADILCADPYSEQLAESGLHRPLIVRVADHLRDPISWCLLEGNFKNINDAKQAVHHFLHDYPSFAPRPQKILPTLVPPSLRQTRRRA